MRFLLDELEELLAHIRLYGRHRTEVVSFGLHWKYCYHLNPRGKRCWRWAVYDSYCGPHITSCYAYCGLDCK